MSVNTFCLDSVDRSVMIKRMLDGLNTAPGATLQPDGSTGSPCQNSVSYVGHSNDAR